MSTAFNWIRSKKIFKKKGKGKKEEKIDYVSLIRPIG